LKRNARTLDVYAKGLLTAAETQRKDATCSKVLRSAGKGKSRATEEIGGESVRGEESTVAIWIKRKGPRKGLTKTAKEKKKSFQKAIQRDRRQGKSEHHWGKGVGRRLWQA